MKHALPLSRCSIFFSLALFGYWIAIAALYSLMSHTVENKLTILTKYEFLSGASYLFSAKQTLEYFYRRFMRIPTDKEYWTIVTSSALIAAAIQNIAWTVAGTSINAQERCAILILIFGAVALGYLDWPPFRYRNRKPE